MKKFTTFITRFRDILRDEYIKYTFIFLGLTLTVYFYMVFAGMASTPTFAYAEF